MSNIYPWQIPAWQRLQQAIANNHLHHALLFSGEAGCGNERFLAALANSLLCLNPASDGYACGECRSCKVQAAGAHPDFMAVGILDDKQSILIDQIRELNYFLNLSRSYSPRRAVIIHPAERMNANAANSLLKSLEEPAADTHILLLTENPAVLLPTIRSRCLAIRLPLPTHQQSVAWLQQQTLQHSVESLLATALGRPLMALALDSTDTLSHRTQWLTHLTQCLQGQGNITEISAHWEKFDKVQLLDWQFTWLQSLLKQRAGNDSTIITGPSSHRLLSMYDKLLELKKLSTHPLNPRLFIESMLILWQAQH